MAVADRAKTQNGVSSVSRPLVFRFALNWEAIAYAVIALIAVATRFWDLGSRAIHHDESLHALYSWYLYIGRGYVHDPMMHGPFQFFGNAFFYLLFGASDYTARMLAATSGVWLVLAPYFLRREMGRLAAIVASILFAFSPVFLYFSRFTREDIYMAAWEMVMVVGLFGYLRTKAPRWLYTAVIGLGFAFATKESVYITGFIFVMAFVIEAGFALGRGRSPRGWTLLASLSPRDWVVTVAIFFTIYVLLFTTFFTNPKGIISGSIGALQYWFAQHDVQRGGQPAFYYLMLLPLYEFLPLSAAIAGLVVAAVQRTLSRQNFFVWFMAIWFLSALVIYSYAGEKMPWIMTHITQPLIFLAAVSVAGLLRRLNRSLLRSGPALLALCLTGILAATLLGGMVAAEPVTGTQLGLQAAQLQRLAMWLLVVVLLAGLVGIGVRYGSRLVLVPAGLGFAVALFLLSVHTAWGVAYARGDVPQDMLVYVQTSPDVPRFVQEIDRISYQTGAGKDMKILLDGGYNDETGQHESIAWPFEWYLRDYKARTYYSKTLPTPADAPVILAMSSNEEPIRNQLSNYVAVHGRLNWWYPEDYKTLTWEKVWQGLQDASVRAKLWRYFFYRETLNPLGAREIDFFVRSDLARGIPLQMGAQPPAPSVPSAPAAQIGDGVAQAAPGGLTIYGKSATGTNLLAEPRGIALATDGTLYVVDSFASKVTAFRPDGTIAYQWGKKGSGDGEFSEPWGIAVAPDGDVYVADTWNHRVQHFDRTGKFISKWGGFVDAKGQLGVQPGSFWGPRDLVVTSAGNVIVSDAGNKRVQVFDRDGKFITMFGGDGTEAGKLKEPVGIAADGAGNIYVADTWNRRIQKFDSQFRPVAQIPVSGWDSQSVVNKPYLAVSEDGHIFYTVPEKNQFVVVTPDGKQEAARGAQGSDPQSFNLPIGIAVSRQGEVFISDTANTRVVKYSSWR
ncbi:MAG TPA: flippase activity-associated protein Agl23 [Chloroflexota bacterium]|nr:flippase activity-associated protein Agl23 [Chloroflexota bacterium]